VDAITFLFHEFDHPAVYLMLYRDFRVYYEKKNYFRVD